MAEDAGDLTVVYVVGRLNTAADYLSQWAYPDCKCLADISKHGDEAETAEAMGIIELEERSTFLSRPNR